MLVVSDTSPISSLLQMGRAELLRDLFKNVCIPPAVNNELARYHTAIPSFVEVRSVTDQARVRSLLPNLDLGEAEAIVLAAECQADYLLIDERRGRIVAAQHGVLTIGLLGVLLLAKQRQLVASVKDCISDLQTKAGFYISASLVRRVLEAASESDPALLHGEARSTTGTTVGTQPMQFFVGTSGYSYPKWKGSFYPEKLPQKEMLSYYAGRFGAVEINNSFYKMPSESDVRSWASQVPENFRFAIKAPQTITHFKRLKDAEEATKHLFDVAATLKGRQGPVLLGLPPNFRKDVPRLNAFLSLVPKKTQAAFEFRHESWFDDEVIECLRARQCALCVADAEELPRTKLIATANWGYIRLRRENYTMKSLATWFEQMSSQPWKEAYVFFKHEDTGTGPKFAAQFLEVANG